MGNKMPPPKRMPTMEETIIEMKMTARRFANESKKAETEEKQNMAKAKAAMKKNNEEGAKMYLMTAASKHNEGTVLSLRSPEHATNVDEDGQSDNDDKER